VATGAPETLTFDHVHLSAPDQAKAAAWYMQHLDAVPGASPERVLVGDRLWLIFYQTAGAPPSRHGAIDSIGLSVPNVDAAIRRLEHAGARVQTPARDVPGLYRAGTVEDPWGASLTILHDPDVRGLHHVHLRMPDPESAFAWYLEMFGGARGRLKGQLDGLQYGGVWLLADRGESKPSAGHAIDHIAWRTPQLDTKAVELKSKGVAFTMEPRQFNGTVRISFVEGPAGTRIELLQRA